MQANEMLQEKKKGKTKVLLYWTFVILSATVFCYITYPKNKPIEKIYIERDSVKICPRREVESKMNCLIITGHQILDVDLTDSAYAKITYR